MHFFKASLFDLVIYTFFQTLDQFPLAFPRSGNG